MHVDPRPYHAEHDDGDQGARGPFGATVELGQAGVLVGDPPAGGQGAPMPAGVGLLGAADPRRRPAVALLGGQFGADGAAALGAAPGSRPFREFAFGGDLRVGEHLDQGRVVLQGEFAARGLHPAGQRGDLVAGPVGVGGLVLGHRRPSPGAGRCRTVARTYV
ncbi:hypothetical protein [Nocardia farcinica]|uniref:hypothetical protein n=1 Tax=Nocardia farcinica TaxID=37329 RepID=UPI002453EC3D|nr:hypothetical protein [Nocardia farcinica]